MMPFFITMKENGYKWMEDARKGHKYKSYNVIEVKWN